MNEEKKAALECAVKLAGEFARQGEYDALMDNTLLTDFGEKVVIPLAELFEKWLKK